MSAPHILFRSDNLEVRHISGADKRRHVVTFDPWHAEATLDRPGFAQDFLAKHGIAATHVLTRDNDWYQYPELGEALAAVRAATAGSERVMTYGISMGAYAAIRFADAVGAQSSLAISPQYSIDPAKVPFEDRWGQIRRRLTFLDAVDGPVACGHAPILIYDPTDRDCHHVARFAQDITIQAVPIRHGGHPAITYLAEAGMLSGIVLAALDGTFDPAAMLAALRVRRRKMAFHHAQLARAQPAWRPRAALALATRAQAIAPNSPLANNVLANALSAVEDHEQAIARHEDALTAGARFPTLLYDYATALAAAGRHEHALAIVDELIGLLPASADVRHLRYRIFRAQGTHRAALVTAWSMWRMDPRHRHYRKLLARSLGAWAASRLLTPFARHRKG